MKKRILSLLLFAVILCFPLSDAALSQTKTVLVTVSAVNTERGADQIILYNQGGTPTGTNQWGYEVTVTNGRVSALGGNNSLVPTEENSYVLSAHGAAIELLLQIEPGMKAEYTPEKGTVLFTLDEYAPGAFLAQKRYSALSAADLAREAGYIVAEEIDSLLAETEAAYSRLPQILSPEEAQPLIEAYEALALLFRDAPVAEYRGIWVRPTQRSDAEVEAFVRKCCAAGINMISVEVLFDCTTVCPMPEDSYFEQNPYFLGFDVLDSFSRMCQRYGVELHLWMHTFCVGDPQSKNASLGILAKRPEWRLTDSNGNPNEYFLNPASEEVRACLAETYAYLLETYSCHAFQLDTIRYPHAENGIDHGYDNTTVEMFKAQYPRHKDAEIVYDPTAAYWQDWSAFRARQVTLLVERVHGVVEETAPAVLLSADVGAVMSASAASCYQDSARWIRGGLLDLIHPMAYGAEDGQNVEEFLALAQGECLVIPALGAFVEGFDKQDILVQSSQMLSMGCAGVAFFAEAEFFGKDCDDLLKKTLFALPALPPSWNYANRAVAELERLLLRLDTAGLSELKSQAQQALAIIKTRGTDAGRETLQVLLSSVNSLPESNLIHRIRQDVQNACRAADDNLRKDTYTGDNPYRVPLPENSMGQTQLVIHKINAAHTGEDTVLITDPLRYTEYKIDYAYLMLLAPVPEKPGVYRLAEAFRNYGAPHAFETEITPGMLLLSLHSDDVGQGLEQLEPAKAIPVGTELVLWGIDLETASFSALGSMVYLPAPSAPEVPLPQKPLDTPSVSPAESIDALRDSDGRQALPLLLLGTGILIAVVLLILLLRRKKA